MLSIESLEVGDPIMFMEEKGVIIPETGVKIPMFTKGKVVEIDKNFGTCTIEVTVGEEKKKVKMYDAYSWRNPERKDPTVRSIIIFTEILQKDEKGCIWDRLGWSSETFVYDGPDGDIKALERYGRELEKIRKENKR